MYMIVTLCLKLHTNTKWGRHLVHNGQEAVDPRAVLDGVEKSARHKQNPNFPVIQPIPYHYTDQALKYEISLFTET
jgi:hypothetical protein